MSPPAPHPDPDPSCDDPAGAPGGAARVREALVDDARLTVLHADMDAFFAAVEVLDDPSLRQRPLIIGYPGRRGVVSTASYEARRFGVHSAMPSVEALRRCPQAVWRRPRMTRYAEVSRQVRGIFQRFTPLIEPLSLDEAFLDVAGSRRLFGSAPAIARALQEAVERETGGLTVSVGVAPNKFLAKLASDLVKPRGLTVIDPERAAQQIAPLPIRRLWGVGVKTATRLHALGLQTIGDVVRVGHPFLTRQLGRAHGEHLWELAHGRDERAVLTEHDARSISTESTFETDLRDPERIDRFLFAAAESVAEQLRAAGLRARTIQLKVRTGSYRTWTRAVTRETPTDLPQELHQEARRLLAERIELGGEGIRLLGVGARGFVDRGAPTQAQLFEEGPGAARRAARVSDAIRERLGPTAITRARLLGADPPAPRE